MASNALGERSAVDYLVSPFDGGDGE